MYKSVFALFAAVTFAFAGDTKGQAPAKAQAPAKGQDAGKAQAPAKGQTPAKGQDGKAQAPVGVVVKEKHVVREKVGGLFANLRARKAAVAACNCE